MILSINHAHYVNDYKIYIMFNNHQAGIVDLESTFVTDSRQIFKELIDIEKFKRFSVKADTLVWENGLDLAPEFLYEKVKASDFKAEL